MPSQTPLHSSLKYSWQQSVVDVLREVDSERLPDKISEAERAVSARLVQQIADRDEQLALRGAVIVLECLRQVNVGKL